MFWKSSSLRVNELRSRQNPASSSPSLRASLSSRSISASMSARVCSSSWSSSSATESSSSRPCRSASRASCSAAAGTWALTLFRNSTNESRSRVALASRRVYASTSSSEHSRQMGWSMLVRALSTSNRRSERRRSCDCALWSSSSGAPPSCSRPAAPLGRPEPGGGGGGSIWDSVSTTNDSTGFW